MITYKLFLTKEAKAPAIVMPWYWMLKYFVKPALENHPYYRIDDNFGNLVCEREIISGVKEG